MKTPNAAVAVAALAAALALTGCTPSERAVGNPDAPLKPNPTAPQLAADTQVVVHNDADVAFAKSMSASHDQGLALTATVSGKDASAEVSAIAETIAQTLEPEAAQLQELLRSWGVEPSSTEPSAAPAPGAATPEQLEQLEQASGTEFDRMFLQLMIAHNEAAVQVAQTEVTGGMDPDAQALAQKIVDEQTAQITQMRTLLG